MGIAPRSTIYSGHTEPETRSGPAARSYLPIDAVRSAYYLRLLAKDKPGTLADVSRILADRGISMEAILQKEPAAGATDVPVIILTQRVREGEVDSAITAIEALDSISAPVTRIRVEPLDAH